MADTTIERIVTRLHRCRWVDHLDVGDGRAADELAAVATEWERLARASGITPDTAFFYREAAADLRLRATAPRGVARVRALVACRGELGVSPGSVAAERLVVDHDVTLRIIHRGAAAVLATVKRWCELVQDRRLHLLLDDPDHGGIGTLTVSGTLFDCSITTVGALSGDDHPAVAEFLRPAGRRRGDRPPPALAVTVDEVDALLAAVAAPEVLAATR